MEKSTSVERRKQEEIESIQQEDCTVNINVSLLAGVYAGKRSPRPSCNLCTRLIEMNGS